VWLFRIEEVQRAIDEALSPFGFQRTEGTEYADADHAFDRWIREVSWRRDIFQVVYRPGRSPNRLSANVSIVLLPKEGSPIEFNSGDVPYLVSRKDFASMYVPDERRSTAELTKLLAEDASKVAEWFEQASDPWSAFDYIREKKEREKWTHLGRYNKIVSALDEFAVHMDKPSRPAGSKYVEPARSPGLIDDIVDATTIVRALPPSDVPSITFSLRSSSPDVRQELREIVVPRTLALAAGASPPVGFSEESDLSGTDEGVVWRADSIAIPFDKELVLTIPCRQFLRLRGQIQLGILVIGQNAKLHKSVVLTVLPQRPPETGDNSR
jgi:hypothetical protein